MMADRSIHDFTVTLDTHATGAQKVVVHLDREGQPRLTIACGVEQLVWVCEDDDYFTQGYRSTLARTIVDCRTAGWSFELLARELGVSPAQAVQLHADAVAEAAEKALAAAVA